MVRTIAAAVLGCAADSCVMSHAVVAKARSGGLDAEGMNAATTSAR
jgi:hypothetical protein